MLNAEAKEPVKRVARAQRFPCGNQGGACREVALGKEIRLRGLFLMPGGSEASDVSFSEGDGTLRDGSPHVLSRLAVNVMLGEDVIR